MKIFPRNPLRLIVLCLLGAGLIAWRIAAVRLAHRVHDHAGIMSGEQAELFDGALESLHDLYGVDLQYFIYRDSQAYDARATALRIARNRRVGGDVGARGLVVILDYGRGRMAVEVGPHLQGIFTDAFTGYLLRTHLSQFNDRANAELGLRGLTLLITRRVEEALLGNEWDPRRLEQVRDSTALAIGGGAQLAMRFGVDTRARPRLPEELQARFAAQPTPRLLLERYREWTTLDPIDHRVGLFTPSSQAALDNMPYTRPFEDIAFFETLAQYEFLVRDSLAVMYATSSPLIRPALLRRSPEGWQFDVRAEWRCVPELQVRGYTWGWTDCPDPYDSVFYDRLEPVDSVWRMIGGDNRPLPVGKGRYDDRLSLGNEIRRLWRALFQPE